MSEENPISSKSPIQIAGSMEIMKVTQEEYRSTNKNLKKLHEEHRLCINKMNQDNLYEDTMGLTDVR